MRRVASSVVILVGACQLTTSSPGPDVTSEGGPIAGTEIASGDEEARGRAADSWSAVVDRYRAAQVVRLYVIWEDHTRAAGGLEVGTRRGRVTVVPDGRFVVDTPRGHDRWVYADGRLRHAVGGAYREEVAELAGLQTALTTLFTGPGYLRMEPLGPDEANAEAVPGRHAVRIALGPDERVVVGMTQQKIVGLHHIRGEQVFRVHVRGETLDPALPDGFFGPRPAPATDEELAEFNRILKDDSM